MVEIEYKPYDNEEEYYNAIMTHIVNRAACFNREKFSYIVTAFPDTPAGCVGYALASILNMVTGIPVYCPKESMKSRFWHDHPGIKPLGKFTFPMAARKKEALHLHMTNDEMELNPAFIDVTDEDIEKIATLFYNWVECDEDKEGE